MKGIKRANYQNIIYIKYMSHKEHVCMIPRAMLLARPPMPDRPRVMTQTKKETLALGVGGSV